MTRTNACALVCARFTHDRSVCPEVFVAGSYRREGINPPYCQPVDTSRTGPIGSRDPEHIKAVVMAQRALQGLRAFWRGNRCRVKP